MTAATPHHRDEGVQLALGLGIGWGLGSLAMALMWNTVNVLLLRYLTDYLGLAAAVASALLATSKLYDAVLNPLMGVASDRADTRWGRRRPFMLGGTLLCALALPMLFWLPQYVPPGWLLPAAAFGVLFYATAYTAFNVPYLAMPAEMGLAYHERSRLMTFRVAAIGIGQLTAGMAAPLLVGMLGGGAAGHAAMSWVLAALVLAGGLACVWGTRSAPFTLRAEAVRSTRAAQLRLTLNNRPFVVLMLVKLLQLLGVALHQAALAFFAAHVLRMGHSAIALILTASTVAMLASLPVWLRVSRRIGKVRTFQAGAAIYAAGTLTWLWTGEGTATAVVVAIPAVTGVASAAMLLIGQSLLPDTITYDRELTGQNREGALTGVYSMVEKIAFALGLVLAGGVLTAGGYASGVGDASDRQSADAIAAVYACFATLPALCSLAAGAALFWYRLERGPRDRGRPVDHAATRSASPAPASLARMAAAPGSASGSRALAVATMLAATAVCVHGAEATERSPAASPAGATPAGLAEKRGERLYIQCRACHALGTDTEGKIGPPLGGFMARPAASVSGYAYSPALQHSKLAWTDATLDRWLQNPSAVVPGTSMVFAGVPKPEDRQQLIAYLKRATDTARPLTGR